MSVAFTPEQRAAIDDRAGSALLAANAGSGKTAVMAERCVEAVLRDGVAVGSILALTFTEKAAGELRDRIRRRFVSLGEEEAARAVDAGWIGTIHGFCARVLRARPLAAGLDPRFEVSTRRPPSGWRATRTTRPSRRGWASAARPPSTSPPRTAPVCATSCSAPIPPSARAARRALR
jgi:ATP-dependent exoDNAse (exonuclease V) beta subunit